MKARIDMSTCTYKIKDRVVICIISAIIKENAINNMNHPFTKPLYVDIADKKIIAKGVAICNKNDIFDEEKGKKIARAKAEKIILDEVLDYLAKCKIHLDKTEIILDSRIKEITYLKNHQKEYI